MESAVSRSPRIIELNGGYKQHLNCTNKNCLPCNSAPPGGNTKIVKNLATSFCKVDEVGLEENLKKKSKMQGKKSDAEPQGKKKYGMGLKGTKNYASDGAKHGKSKKI